MKISGNNGIGNILKIFLQVCMVIGVIILIILYWLTKSLNITFDWFIFMIYPCGIAFLVLMYQFIGLFNTLKINTPFCEDNVKRMKIGMTSSFLISLFVLIGLLITIFAYNYYALQFQVALGFIMILFFGVGIALYILSELFREATNYKEENDLTI